MVALRETGVEEWDAADVFGEGVGDGGELFLWVCGALRVTLLSCGVWRWNRIAGRKVNLFVLFELVSSAVKRAGECFRL